MRFRVSAFVLMFVSAAAAALGQCSNPAPGFVLVCASSLTDSSGNLISNATVSFQPTDNNGNKISYRVGGHGQAISWPSTAAVTSGAFQIKVADTFSTSPQNICYAVTVTDNSTGNIQLSSGYGCVQPAGPFVLVGGETVPSWCTGATIITQGGTCNFDSYPPNFATGVVVQAGPTGPAGPASTVPGPTGPTGPTGVSLNPRGTYSSGATYAPGDLVVSSGVNYTCITGCSGVTPTGGANWMVTTGTALSTLQNNQLASVGTPTFVNQGIATPVSGSNYTGGFSMISQIPISTAGTISQVQFFSQGSGTLTIYTATVSALSATLVQSTTASVVSGLNTITGLTLTATPGQFVGVFSTSGLIEFTSTGGAGDWQASGLIGSGTTVTASATLQPEWNWTITPSILLKQAVDETAIAANTAAIAANLFLATTQGVATPVTGTMFSSGFTAISATPISVSGTLTGVSAFYAGGVGGGTATVAVVQLNSDGTLTKVQSQAVTIVAGSNTITVSLPVTAGQYVGLFSSGGTLAFTTGTAAWYTSGLTGTSTARTITAATFEFNWTVTQSVGPAVTAHSASIASLNASVFPSNSSTIYCAGNSLTFGQGGTSYPTQLGPLVPTKTVINAGISATTQPSIMQRFGSYPINFTVAGNSIPTSGAVNVTLQSNVSPILSTGGGPLHGTVIGITASVPGTLAYGSISGTTVTLTFTRDSSGSAVSTYAGVQFILDDTGFENDLVVFWAGRNTIGLQETTGLTAAQQLAVIQQNMTAAIHFLKSVNKHFLIISETNRNDEFSGSTSTASGAALNGDASYTLINQVNAWYQQMWPNNYVEVREVLVNSGNGSGPDNAATAIDIIPPSLKSDFIHLDTAGYLIVAQQVANAITRLGY